MKDQYSSCRSANCIRRDITADWTW